MSANVARGGTALLIEADDAYRASISACIRLAGCNVETVAVPSQAMEELGRRRFDLVIWAPTRTMRIAGCSCWLNFAC